MKKVITYGTYDLLHFGHIRLLERAKALGDYLIVGVTADSFDLARGKINVQQTLIERVEAVKATGIADEIIVEEYVGQKIDDIIRYDIDIFTVGSDWKGHFDYLQEFCEVVYLERTEGISSSEIRSEKRELRIGLIGSSSILDKFVRESRYVNGVTISGVCHFEETELSDTIAHLPLKTSQLDTLLEASDAVYVISTPQNHYQHIRRSLMKGCHVLCESPMVIDTQQWDELMTLARERNLVLADAIKTAYSMAYWRLILMAKSGIIGKIVSVDATCTSLRNMKVDDPRWLERSWNSISAWGPTALLPIFQILGTGYIQRTIATHLLHRESCYDAFTKISFIFPDAVASMKVGQGVKSEGELVISGSKGYIYVPAPWWKTDYFEVRFENASENKRYFYQLAGEGIRYEIMAFVKSINSNKRPGTIDEDVSKAIVNIIHEFHEGKDVYHI